MGSNWGSVEWLWRYCSEPTRMRFPCLVKPRNGTWNLLAPFVSKTGRAEGVEAHCQQAKPTTICGFRLLAVFFPTGWPESAALKSAFVSVGVDPAIWAPCGHDQTVGHAPRLLASLMLEIRGIKGDAIPRAPLDIRFGMGIGFCTCCFCCFGAGCYMVEQKVLAAHLCGWRVFAAASSSRRMPGLLALATQHLHGTKGCSLVPCCGAQQLWGWS